MARYKPKSVAGKLVGNKTKVEKTPAEDAWQITWMGTDPESVLLGCTYDLATDSFTEVTEFKMRREAAAALDEILELADALPSEVTETGDKATVIGAYRARATALRLAAVGVAS